MLGAVILEDHGGEGIDSKVEVATVIFLDG